MVAGQGVIAEAYFQRLLRDTPSGEAVATLAQFWSNRLREDLPMWGVSLPEYQVQLILIYSGEVGNGGHVQFFMNRGVRTVGATITALRATGLDDWAHSLGEACDIAGEDGTAKLSDTAMQLLDDLDLRIYATIADVDDRILTLLRADADQVLRPERGM